MPNSNDDLKAKYEALDWKGPIDTPEAIDSGCLFGFPYDYPDSNAEVIIDTDEFTAVCPWTGLPDIGQVVVRYVPSRVCLELKSMKYYLLSYRNVGIVQEHAANRMLQDFVRVTQPKRMHLKLDYKARGGIHTAVEVSYDTHKGLAQ